MDIEKLIESLQNAAGGPEGIKMCHAAATALSTLQAENKAMQKQLNEFSEFLCRMTGGLLSKTNYTARVMATIAEDYQQKACRECNLQAENEKLRAELDEKEKYYDQMIDALAATDSAELEQVKQERDELERFLGELEGAVYSGQYFHLRPMIENWRSQRED